MATLTITELETYASQAGFTGNDIAIAAAVGLAESGGNASAHNSTPPDDSYGVWQINMFGNLGPARRKQFGISDNSQLFDPATNAKAAHAIFTSSGWGAWTTYTSGAYKKYMPTTSAASAGLTSFLAGLGITAPGGIGTAANTLSSLNPLAGISSSIDNFGKNLFNEGATIAGVLVGLGMFITGIFILNREHVKPVLKTAAKAAAL